MSNAQKIPVSISPLLSSPVVKRSYTSGIPGASPEPSPAPAPSQPSAPSSTPGPVKDGAKQPAANPSPPQAEPTPPPSGGAGGGGFAYDDPTPGPQPQQEIPGMQFNTSDPGAGGDPFSESGDEGMEGGFSADQAKVFGDIAIDQYALFAPMLAQSFAKMDLANIEVEIRRGNVPSEFMEFAKVANEAVENQIIVTEEEKKNLKKALAAMLAEMEWKHANAKTAFFIAMGGSLAKLGIVAAQLRAQNQRNFEEMIKVYRGTATPEERDNVERTNAEQSVHANQASQTPGPVSDGRPDKTVTENLL